MDKLCYQILQCLLSFVTTEDPKFLIQIIEDFYLFIKPLNV